MALCRFISNARQWSTIVIFTATPTPEKWRMTVEMVEGGLRIQAYPGATPFSLFSDRATATFAHDWHRNYALRVEAARGLDATEDHLYAGRFTATLHPGESVTLVATTEPYYGRCHALVFQRDP